MIAIIHRLNDVEDKLIASFDGRLYSAEEMADAIRFQERYYVTHVRALTSDGDTDPVLNI